MDIEQIVNKLISINNREQLVDDAYETYMKIKASSSYPPISDDSITTEYINWIGMFSEELKDLFSRWIWDANRKWKIITEKWKEYKISNWKELINYINKEIEQMKNTIVYWDDYWIRNEPTKETLETELAKLEAMQYRSLESNASVTNTTLIKRQDKIRVIKERLLDNKNIWD